MITLAKEGPFGIEKSKGSWNSPQITLVYNFDELDEFGRSEAWLRGECTSLDRGYAPKARGGCCAIIELLDGTFHFMSEDDDHYVTKLICTHSELIDIRRLIKDYSDVIGSRVDYEKQTEKLHYPKGVKAVMDVCTRGLFTAALKEREPGNKCIFYILKKGSKTPVFSIHVGWLKDALDVFKDL